MTTTPAAPQWRLVLLGAIFIILFYTVEWRRERKAVSLEETLHGNQTVESSVAVPLPLVLLDESIPVQRTLHMNTTGDVQAMAHQLLVGKFCKTGLNLPRAAQNDSVASLDRTLVNISISCSDLYEHAGIGTGNVLISLYGLRLIARTVGNVDVHVHCTDATSDKLATELVVPWIAGTFPAVERQEPTIPTIREVCSDFSKMPLSYMIPTIRYELRRLAVRIAVGSSTNTTTDKVGTWLAGDSQEHPDLGTVMDLETSSTPLIPNLEFDDAVVHFRCGDLIASNHPSFGFIRFESFAHHISPEAKTIGIVTQPFAKIDDDHQQRAVDSQDEHKDRCRWVITEFADYLKRRFPHARITIRNTPGETIAVAFARMVLANQSIAAISTFSVLPVLSTFGTGYIRKPDYKKAPNRFLLYPPPLPANAVLMEEPRLMAAELNQMWKESNGTAVIAWFRGNETDSP